jgi:hypothetical protein
MAKLDIETVFFKQGSFSKIVEDQGEDGRVIVKQKRRRLNRTQTDLPISKQNIQGLDKSQSDGDHTSEKVLRPGP